MVRCHKFGSVTSEEGVVYELRDAQQLKVLRLGLGFGRGSNGHQKSIQGGLVEGIAGCLVGGSLGHRRHDDGHE